MNRWFARALVALTAQLVGCVSFQPGPLPGEPEDARFTRVQDTRVRYVDVGEGEPVVLVHGYAASSDTWAPFIPHLAEDYRVIALDLKGFGWSGRPEGDYSPPAQAKLVYGLLDKLGVDDFKLVAHSWGSSVALQMALDQPDRIERIALFDAYVYAEQLPTAFHWSRAPGVGEFIFGAFYDQRLDEKATLSFYDPETYVTQELVDEYKEAVARPGTKAAALAAVRGQRYEKVQQQYSTIDQPVLLLWGRDDKVTPLRFGERLYRQLPQAELTVYPQCGHFPMVEASNASRRDLMEFLAAGGER